MWFSSSRRGKGDPESNINITSSNICPGRDTNFNPNYNTFLVNHQSTDPVNDRLWRADYITRAQNNFTHAVKSGDTELVRQQLKHATDVNTSLDDARNTPLHVASMNNWSEMVNLLLGHSEIDINALNANGATALMIASSRGHGDVVKALLSHPKVDVDIRSETGDTARWYALQNHHGDVGKLFEKLERSSFLYRLSIDIRVPGIFFAQCGVGISRTGIIIGFFVYLMLACMVWRHREGAVEALMFIVAYVGWAPLFAKSSYGM